MEGHLLRPLARRFKSSALFRPHVSDGPAAAANADGHETWLLQHSPPAGASRYVGDDSSRVAIVIQRGWRHASRHTRYMSLRSFDGSEVQASSRVPSSDVRQLLMVDERTKQRMERAGLTPDDASLERLRDEIHF